MLPNSERVNGVNIDLANFAWRSFLKIRRILLLPVFVTFAIPAYSQSIHPKFSAGREIFTSDPTYRYRYGAEVIETAPNTLHAWYCADLPSGQSIIGSLYNSASSFATRTVSAGGSFGVEFSLKRRMLNAMSNTPVNYLQFKIGQMGFSSGMQATVRMFRKLNSGDSYLATISRSPIYEKRISIKSNSWIKIEGNDITNDKRDPNQNEFVDYGIGPGPFELSRSYIITVSAATGYSGRLGTQPASVEIRTTKVSSNQNSVYIGGAIVPGEIELKISTRPVDVITHASSTNNGATWTNSDVAILPSYGADQYSACDPAVVFDGTYYYLAYGSTPNQIGWGSLFVARSTSPSGPWSKWNGSGWGGDPKPFVRLRNSDVFGDPITPAIEGSDPAPQRIYGMGQPSLVINNGNIMLYYSDILDFWGSDKKVMFSQAPIQSNWPAHLSAPTVAFDMSNIPSLENGGGKLRVKYLDKQKVYVGVSELDRNSPKSRLVFFRSEEGSRFFRSSEVSKGVVPCYACHSSTISSLPNGHINEAKKNWVLYSEGYLNPNSSIETFDFEDMPVQMFEVDWDSKGQAPTDILLR